MNNDTAALYRYFENKRGKSNKFWEVTVKPGYPQGWDVLRRWGKIGTPGQTTRDNASTKDQALTFAESKCGEKYGRGYEEVEREILTTGEKKILRDGMKEILDQVEDESPIALDRFTFLD